MLGYDKESKQFINEQLCEELSQISEIKGLLCNKCYCVGNSSSGKLVVCVDESQCLNNEIPVQGKSIVCCEFVLPSTVCEHDLVKAATQHVSGEKYVKCYIVINEDKVNKFCREVYSVFLQPLTHRIKVCGVRTYGNVCLSMLSDVQYCESLREAFDIVGLDAEFVADRSKVKFGGDVGYLGKIKGFFASKRQPSGTGGAHGSSTSSHGVTKIDLRKGKGKSSTKAEGSDKKQLISGGDTDSEQDKSDIASGGMDIVSTSGVGGGGIPKVTKK